jgi:Ca2+-binding EF-hand superfamily protein
MKALGFDKRNPDIFKMISEIKGDKDNKIGFDEFIDLMSG